jgi:hypothetical protein
MASLAGGGVAAAQGRRLRRHAVLVALRSPARLTQLYASRGAGQPRAAYNSSCPPQHRGYRPAGGGAGNQLEPPSGPPMASPAAAPAVLPLGLGTLRVTGSLGSIISTARALTPSRHSGMMRAPDCAYARPQPERLQRMTCPIRTQVRPQGHNTTSGQQRRSTGRRFLPCSGNIISRLSWQRFWCRRWARSPAGTGAVLPR